MHTRLIDLIYTISSRSRRAACLLLATCLLQACSTNPVERPLSLAQALPDGALKQRLLACQNQALRPTSFSIAHRGAPLGYPEHTREGYEAAARMGAGLIECDVTFTRDRELVCRHSQCDLHRTTNILQTDLAQRCTAGFTPATSATPADAKCCTSDITLAEYRTLCGRRDIIANEATTVAEYLHEPPLRVEAPPLSCGTLMTHAESIRLLDDLGVDFIPELKRPEVPMADDFSQADYAARMLSEYTAAGIPAERVHPQSFSLTDIHYWIKAHPVFAAQVVYLDPRGRDPAFQPTQEDMRALRDAGITTLAPPIPMLIALNDRQEIVPSEYARMATEAGFRLVTWTLESGRADDPDNWLYGPVAAVMHNEAMMLEVLDVLVTDVGIAGIFSDWPATATYYANCLLDR